jgi:hypothetical protein
MQAKAHEGPSKDRSKSPPATGRGASRKKPTWRRAFDVIERPVSRSLEGAIQTSHFAGILSLGLTVDRLALGKLEEYSGWLLHRINIPAASDIKSMLRLLNRIDGRLEHTAAILQKLEDEAADVQLANLNGRSPTGRAPGLAESNLKMASKGSHAQHPE